MTARLLSRRLGYPAAALLVALTIGLLRLSPSLTGAAQALILLVSVFLVAWIWESGPGVFAALLATLGFNYFFLPPHFTLTIEDPRNVVALLVFLAAALLVGRLSATSRFRARELEAERRDLLSLTQLSQAFLADTNRESLLEVAADRLRRVLQGDHVSIFVAEAEGARLRLGAASGGAEPKKELVDQAFDPGNVTATRLESGRVDVYLPIRLGVHRIGALAVLGMRVSERMAAGCTALLGLALEREKFLRLARAAEEIRIREEMKSTLLATLAHDLKTPVTAARAAVENMEAERGASERTRLAKESMQKLTRLIDDLLNVVKLEAGAAHPERERVWCGAILDAAVERFGDALGAHTLHVEAPPPEWAVNVDPAQVAEALGLGLENAARYSPSGGPVDVSVVRKGGTLALRVDDAGAGIPMGERKRVLDKFVRLPGNDGIPGSGLGLYLARTLVEMNGGRVEIGESERHGTRFEILLPEASS